MRSRHDRPARWFADFHPFCSDPQLGPFAPPFGVGYHAGCAVGRVDPAEGIRPIWGYLLALMVDLIIVAIFPWIFIGFL